MVTGLGQKTSISQNLEYAFLKHHTRYLRMLSPATIIL